MEVKELREVRELGTDLQDRSIQIGLDLLRGGRLAALPLTFFNVPLLMSKATIGIPGGKLSRTQLKREAPIWPRA